MPRGGDARERACDAGDPSSGSTSCQPNIESYERSHGDDGIARAVAFEIARARALAETELVQANVEAHAAVARLQAAQRRFSIFTATDVPPTADGAASSTGPTAASEACARGASLARSAWAVEASLDSALWLGPEAPSASATPGLDAWDVDRSFSQFTEDFRRTFDPRRPERGYEPPAQVSPVDGGQLPGPRWMYRCTWCRQPIRGDHVVCSWCDASFCDDCVWEVAADVRPYEAGLQRHSCGRCSEGSGPLYRDQAPQDGPGSAAPRRPSTPQ